MKTNVKKGSKKNFTKLTQRSGISLIVLIVTIIVIIILAAVVILTILKNNPVESAKEARFKEDVRSFQDELAMTISKEYTDLGGQRNTKINATGYGKNSSNEEEYNNSVYKYIPSFTKEYEGKFIIQNDELVYVEEKVTEKEAKLLNDLGIGAKVKTAAEKIEEDPKSYYGRKVTNYSANGIGDWKIFYADEKNVYLITSEYVPLSKLPTTSAGHKPKNTDPNTDSPNAANFRDILNDYNGTADIANPAIQALNSDYFSKGYTSENNNMKAVAYMLDTEIWKVFAGEKSEYAIGGPTVEMLMKSYSKKYGVDYRAQASDSTGYQISKNGGANWGNHYNGMLNTSDTLYVLPSTDTVLESGNKSGAVGMWLASPWTGSSSVVAVRGGGTVMDGRCTIDILGFRPVVCLKSNVTLKAVEGGYEIQ